MVNLSFVIPSGDRIPPSVRDGYDRRVLKTITTQSVSAAIWRRQLSSRLSQWLSTQNPARMLQLGLVVRPKFLFDEVSQAADAAGITDCHDRELFVSDLAELAADFARIVKTANVEVRLTLEDEKDLQAEVTTGDTRLVTVYRVAAVRHLHQGSGPVSRDWEMVNGRTVIPLPAAAVVMLKHRSSSPAAKPSYMRATMPSPGAARAPRLFYMLRVSP